LVVMGRLSAPTGISDTSMDCHLTHTERLTNQ